MEILKNILKNFSKIFDLNTYHGQDLDLESNGNKSTTNNINILLNFNTEEMNNEKRYYQWIKGDNFAKIVEWSGDIVQDEDFNNFLIFNDKI